HERDIADYLIGKMTEMGLNVIEDQAGKSIGNIAGRETGNIIATLKGNVPNAPTLLFSAHMDTVEPGRGVQPVIKDDVIYSDGTTVLGSDDKAGIAAVLEALQTIRDEELPHGDIEIVFTVSEEVGLLGAKNLDYKRLKAVYGFVTDCDGSAGTIITKAPSQHRITASIIGKAAHAGINPEVGVNAIYVASSAISKMQLGRIDEETTANIGVIQGGKATNIIPELVNIEGETRSIDPDKLEEQTNKIVKTLEEVAVEMGAKAIVKTELLYPRLKLEESDKAVALAVRAAENLGLKPVLVSTGGGSDANIFNGYGIPTVNLGIGMSKVHSTEEFIKIEDLVMNAGYVLEIIKAASQVSV
ncbi:MAG TPA: M20/M25/M40 family metallo-hydrolase, partial [Desulfobacteria bacterium]|nr:M20/M25/M40 family metallo-hydrolase [Desulfobacteria bacterium]